MIDVLYSQNKARLMIMPLSILKTTPQSFDVFHEYYLADEAELVNRLRDILNLSKTGRADIFTTSTALIQTCRDIAQDGELFDAFLQEYGLSTDEGVTLMRLAEALIRTPDNPTAHLLLRDKLSGRDWAAHKGQSSSGLVNLSGGLGKNDGRCRRRKLGRAPWGYCPPSRRKSRDGRNERAFRFRPRY